MSGLPYAVPASYAIRLVEESSGTAAPTTTVLREPIQPHASHPTHFEFPRLSLHELTLKTHYQQHYRGPHAPGSVSAPLPTSTPGSTAAWAPATDIRETMRAYHIEIETPGVTDKESILIQWMSRHTLLVQGVARRPGMIGLLDGDEGARVWEGEGDGWAAEVGHARKPPSDGGPLMRTPSRETVEAEFLSDTIPTVLLTERKLGSWRRTFTLPEDVEMKELKARLDAGLLRIDLPKRSVEEEEETRRGGVKIEIE